MTVLELTGLVVAAYLLWRICSKLSYSKVSC